MPDERDATRKIYDVLSRSYDESPANRYFNHKKDYLELFNSINEAADRLDDARLNHKRSD